MRHEHLFSPKDFRICLKCKGSFLNDFGLLQRVQGNYNRSSGLIDTFVYNKMFTLTCNVRDEDYKFKDLLK